jgi:hypothetical protein
MDFIQLPVDREKIKLIKLFFIFSFQTYFVSYILKLGGRVDKGIGVSTLSIPKRLSSWKSRGVLGVLDILRGYLGLSEDLGVPFFMFKCNFKSQYFRPSNVCLEINISATNLEISN